MKLRISKNSRGEIKTPLGTYHRAVENCNHIFYVNFEESDENASVKVFNRKMGLVCENAFAYDELIRVLKADEVSWMSSYMKKMWKNHGQNLVD